MNLKKKVGILGGSFDPVHFGHLNLAISVMEACALEEVWFVPTSLSPFKQNTAPIASRKDRKEMLKLALNSIPNVFILDWELQRKGPVFAIETVRQLSLDSLLELHLVLGEDHLTSFYRWKDAEALIRLAPPWIGTRELKEISSLSDRVYETLLERRVKIPLFEVSSTQVRMRLAQKRYCGHLVPPAVLDYIDQHHLYLSPSL